MLSHRNLIANTLQCSAWIGVGRPSPEERVLTPLPLYHIFSLTANLLVFAHFGGLNVLIPDPRDLHRLIRTMRDGRTTAASGVNTLFNALVNRPDSRRSISPACASLSAAALRCRRKCPAAGAKSPAEIWSKATV